MLVRRNHLARKVSNANQRFFVGHHGRGRGAVSRRDAPDCRAGRAGPVTFDDLPHCLSRSAAARRRSPASPTRRPQKPYTAFWSWRDRSHRAVASVAQDRRDEGRRVPHRRRAQAGPGGYDPDLRTHRGSKVWLLPTPRPTPNKRCWRSRRNPASSLRVVSTGCLGQPRCIRPRSLRCSRKRLHRRVHRVRWSRQRRS